MPCASCSIGGRVENAPLFCDLRLPMTLDRARQVLIVDDDQPTQNLLVALMERDGLQTTVARDGREAIELLTTRRFDLVILDIMMPGVDGRGVIAHLRRQPARPPVIVCTATSATSVAELRGEADVVKAVLRKPFDIVQLSEAVAGLVGARDARAGVARILVVDDDLRARYVMRAFAEPAEVIDAESAEEALRLIREHPPDAILLDLVLPGVQGEELLRELRASADTAAIPIVVVTSQRLDDSARADLLRFASGILFKGDLSRDTVRAALETALR
jgi:CheY-like chemotaxis protein